MTKSKFVTINDLSVGQIVYLTNLEGQGILTARVIGTKEINGEPYVSLSGLDNQTNGSLVPISFIWGSKDDVIADNTPDVEIKPIKLNCKETDIIRKGIIDYTKAINAGTEYIQFQGSRYLYILDETFDDITRKAKQVIRTTENLISFVEGSKVNEHKPAVSAEPSSIQDMIIDLFSVYFTEATMKLISENYTMNIPTLIAKLIQSEKETDDQWVERNGEPHLLTISDYTDHIIEWSYYHNRYQMIDYRYGDGVETIDRKRRRLSMELTKLMSRISRSSVEI